MDNRQNSKYDMYDLLKMYLLTVSPAILLAMPYFTGFFTTFQNLLTQLAGYLNVQERQRQAYAVNKEQMATTLIDAIVDLAAVLMAYASATDNTILLGQSDYKKAMLSKLSDLELIAAAGIVKGLANANIAELADFGITVISMGLFHDKITNFSDAKNVPRDEIDQKKEATTEIATTIAAIDKILKKMDRLVRTRRSANRAFFNQYFERRKPVAPPTNKLSGRGTIVDINGLPLSFVQYTCFQLDIDRKSSEKGRFNLKNITEGVWEFTFISPGYQTVTQSFIFRQGNRVEILVTMKLHENLTPA